MDRVSAEIYQKQIEDLQNDFDKMEARLEGKVKRRNWFIGGVIALVTLAVLAGGFAYHTDVMTISFDKDSLGIQLAKAKVELEDAKLKINDFTAKASQLIPETEKNTAKVSDFRTSEQLFQDTARANKKCVVVGIISLGLFFLGGITFVIALKSPLAISELFMAISLIVSMISFLGCAACGIVYSDNNAHLLRSQQSITISTPINNSQIPASADQPRPEY